MMSYFHVLYLLQLIVAGSMYCLVFTCYMLQFATFFQFMRAVFAGFEERGTEVTVDVIVGHDVALECAFLDGSNPTPNIQWVQCSECDGNDDTVLEDSTGTSPRYLDGGRYLLLDVDNNVLNQNYTCIVTNSEQFQTARFPTKYILNAGEH